MSLAFVVPSLLAYYRFPSAYHHSAMQTVITYGTTNVINACTITVAAVFPLLAVSSLCPTIQTSWVGAVVIETTVFKCVSPI